MAGAFDPYHKWLGIPPEEQPPNHYRLLGVPRYECDPDVLENAAHRQMAYVRTFQSGQHAAESQKLLNELATAKVCLLSSAKKTFYDETLRQQQSASPTPSSVPAPPPVVVSEARIHVKSPKIHAAVNSPTRRAPTKQLHFWAPVLTSLGGVLLIVILVTAYVASRKPVPDKSSDSADDGEFADANAMFSEPSPKTGPSSGDPQHATRRSIASRPKGPDPLAQERPPDGKESTKGMTEPRVPDREDRLRQQLDTLREAFGRRDMSRMRTIASVANRAQRNPRVKEEIDQVQTLGRYLDEFWKCAQRGLAKADKQLHPAPVKKDVTVEAKPEAPEGTAKSSAEVVGGPVRVTLLDHSLEILDVTDDKVSYRVGEETRKVALRELPSLDAAALASYGLKDDDLFGRVYVASFLCVDEMGDHTTNVQFAQRIARALAEQSDSPFLYLEHELERAAAEPQPNQP